MQKGDFLSLWDCIGVAHLKDMKSLFSAKMIYMGWLKNALFPVSLDDLRGPLDQA